MAGRATTDRVMYKMRANLGRGAFYEAQQMLKTVYYRYRSRRLYQESYDVVEDGACLQLKEGQVMLCSACFSSKQSFHVYSIAYLCRHLGVSEHFLLQ